MAEYIEREKVYEMLNALGGCGAEPESWADGWDKAIDTAIDELNKIPAADVCPERHGRWILDDSDEYANHYHCSVCGAKKDTCNEIYDEPLPNYCENCGAKMDGKGEDILVKREDEHASEKMLESLPNCPICGAKAYLQGDTVDGFWFGWSVGCPRYCLNDGIHGHNDNTPKRDHFSKHGFETKYTAKRWWINRVKRAIMGGKDDKSDD